MSISASAVLVELNISVWPASKLDRDTTAQVNTDASAVVDAARVHKNLFAGTNLRKEIENFAAKVRLYHNQRTLPWADKGERMLPTALFMEYKQTMNAYEQTFNAMCDSFFQAYPDLVKDAPTHLGKMYKAEDYPQLEDVKMKFGFRRTVKPVPEAGDFRLDIPANDLEEMRAEFNAQQDNKLADAMREPWERLHEMLVGMSKKLDDTSGGKKRYHDTLVSNPLELCSLLTKMNITNDPKLEEARRELELTMLGTNIDAIKEDEHHRTEVKAKVDAIIKKFEWLGHTMANVYDDGLELADLVGRKILAVQMNPTKDDVRFVTTTGNLDYNCYGDCCSESWVNHVNDIDNLIGGTVTQVEEFDFHSMLGVEPEPTRQDSDEVLFHKVHTEKGTCLIEFRNSSNGYYGGSFEKNESGLEPHGLVDITEDF